MASRPSILKKQDTLSGIKLQQVDRYESLTVIDQVGDFIAEPDTQEVMYRTPAGSELFYVHHGRNSTVAERALYTTRLFLNFSKEEGPRVKMYLTASDQPLPLGTEPIDINIEKGIEISCTGRNILIELSILSGSGAPFDLAEANNRIILREAQREKDLAPIYTTLLEDGRTSLVLFRRQHVNIAEPGQIWYQRQSSTGSWTDVVGTRMACK